MFINSFCRLPSSYQHAHFVIGSYNHLPSQAAGSQTKHIYSALGLGADMVVITDWPSCTEPPVTDPLHYPGADMVVITDWPSCTEPPVTDPLHYPGADMVVTTD